MSWKLKALIGIVATLGIVYAVLWYITLEPQRPVNPIPESGSLLIVNATIVDPASGTHSPGQYVLIEQGRIVSVGVNEPQINNDQVERIDATGKYLIPGLNDMHAHPLGPVDPSGDLALMLANGITGFRQMSGSETMLEERRETRLPLGIDAPGLLIMPGALLTPLNASTPEQVRKTVREQREGGADFIKAGLVSGPVLFAAIDEGQSESIPVVGHVPAGVSVMDAANRGMHVIEHLGPANGLLIACSEDADNILADLQASTVFPTVPDIDSHIVAKLAEWALLERVINPAAADQEAGGIEPTRRALASFNEEKCRRAMRELRDLGTWQVPTLIRLKTVYLADEPSFASDPNLGYVSRNTLADWERVTAKFVEIYSAEDREAMRQGYTANMRLVRMLEEEGVPMLAGSDATGGGWLVPGFALHQEFAELSRAGLPPLRILQMTTSDAARFLGRSDTMGLIAPGADADLVLLDADPTEDVENLGRISGVVRAGFWHDRAALDQLLSRVRSNDGTLNSD